MECSEVSVCVCVWLYVCRDFKHKKYLGNIKYIVEAAYKNDAMLLIDMIYCILFLKNI